MTKQEFLKEIEHIAESGSNEIRLGALYNRVIDDAKALVYTAMSDGVLKYGVRVQPKAKDIAELLEKAKIVNN